MNYGVTYSTEELIGLCKTPKKNIYATIEKIGINQSMEWRRAIQVSLAIHKKDLDEYTQMEVVVITMFIERVCRPYIWRKHYMMIRHKYPMITRQKCKNLANDKTEKTIRKYSY
jgi:hypothetical protein